MDTVAQNVHGTDATATVEQKDLNRVIMASVAGSAMEWYDFSIYGTASALVFSELFFPGMDKSLALLAIFATYAVGFVARPFGGLFFGRLGDRKGRKFVLVTTVLLMGVSTLLIGLLPTYHDIGIWAAVLLVGLRLCQGFGSGAEQAGASLIVAEFAPKKSRGFYASLPFAGIIIGILMAAGMFWAVQQLPQDDLMAWGWRIPFLFSIFVIAVGIVIRLKVKESPVFEEIKAKKLASKQPVKDLFKYSRKNLIVACCLRIGENGTSYLYQVFALSYLAKVLMVDKSVGTVGLIIAAACSVITIPLIGHLSDRFGRRIMYRATALIAALWAFPAFWLFNTLNPTFIVVGMVVAISLGAFGMYSVQAAYFPELFDARYRYTGIAVSKEFAALVSGGIAPFVAAALLTWSGNHYWPVATYVLLLAGISFIATFFAPETKGIDINADS